MTDGRRLTGSLPDASGSFTGTFDTTAYQKWEKWVREMDRKASKYTSSAASGYTEKGPAEEWGLALGSIRGYRTWTWQIPASAIGKLGASTLEEDFSRLRGHYRLYWGDGKLEATCDLSVASWDDLVNNPGNAHKVPYPVNCGCGFWATWGPSSGRSPGIGTRGITVYGSVTGTGRVIMGEKGFRSQYAQIESLCIPEEAVEQLSYWRLAGNYGVTRPDSFYPVDFSNLRSPSQPHREPASAGEIATRVSMLEETLGELYPSARIMSGADTLNRVFPPEKEYYRP